MDIFAVLAGGLLVGLLLGAIVGYLFADSRSRKRAADDASAAMQQQGAENKLLEKLNWRHSPNTVMRTLMVDLRHKGREPVFKLCQCHYCSTFRVIVATLLDVGERCTRKTLSSMHERSKKALNMSAIVRQALRSVFHHYSVLTTCPLEHRSSELCSVVSKDFGGYPAN